MDIAVRDRKPGHSRRARAPATARTPRTPASTFRPASSATRTRPRSARWPTSRPKNARSTRRSGWSKSNRGAALALPLRGLQRDPAARRRRSRSPSRSSLFAAPQFIVISARTGGDYGLDADGHLDSSTGSGFPLEAPQQILWGVPAAPSHDPLRVDTRFTPGEESAYFGFLCDSNGSPSTSDPNTGRQTLHDEHRRFRPRKPTARRRPFLQNPTTCDTPLSSSARRPLLRRRPDQRRSTLAADDRLRSAQLQPEPLRPADHHRRPTPPSGIDVDLTVPQPLSPDDPLADRAARRHRHPAGRLLDQPQRRRRQDLLLGRARRSFGTTDEAHCPEFAKIGSLTIDSSALPGPLPGFVYLGRTAAREPLPDLPRRRRLRHPRQARRHGHRRSAHRPADDHLPRTAAEPPDRRFNMHIFGSERGPLASPTRCGTYPVTSTFTPWDASLAGRQTSTQYFTIESGPEGQPCPGSDAPLLPDRPGRLRQPHARRPRSLLARSHALRRRPEPRRAHGDHSAGPLGDARRACATAPQAAIDRLADPLYSGLTELPRPSCPPGAARSAPRSPAPGPATHPVYVPGKVYLAGPYKGAPLSLLVVIPGASRAL